jgi:hypothetical protein
LVYEEEKRQSYQLSKNGTGGKVEFPDIARYLKYT